MPLPSASVHWASHFCQASNEWVLGHLLPVALEVRGRNGNQNTFPLRVPVHLMRSLFIITSLFKSPSPRASLVALVSLLDLLHLPALRQHRLHLAPTCLERLLRLARLLMEASEEEEVSLLIVIKRRDFARTNGLFTLAPLPLFDFRRWPWL